MPSSRTLSDQLLSFSEVAAVMREVRRHTADDARLFLGVTAVSDPAAPLIVTLFGNYSKVLSEEPAPVSARDRAMALVSNAAPAVTAEPAPQTEPEAAPIGGETPEPAEAAFTNDTAESANAKSAAKRKPNRRPCNSNPPRAAGSIRASQPSLKERTSMFPLS